MTYIKEEALKNVSGGGIREIISTEDVMNYVKVLTEAPGIVDRLRISNLSDEDIEVIYHYFVSVDKFVAIARFAQNKTIEELMAIASSNNR